MPVDTVELLNAIGVLADKENVRVNVKRSATGALVCGACCFVGGVLLGPAGLAIGGAAGGITAYKMNAGSYKPLSYIITNELSEREKEALINHVRNAVAQFEVTDLALLLPLLLSNTSIQQSVLKTAITFITNEMKLQIID